jgi:aspartyl protease family protein
MFVRTARYRNWALMLLLVSVSPAVLAEVEVLGLFTGSALLKIDGQQKLLKVGQQHKGVSLLEADSFKAVLDVNGERATLGISQHISTNYQQPTHTRVTIPTNEHRQYITSAQINGVATRVLVDTGANILALNSGAARAMGVDYKRGIPGRVQTAAGVVSAYRVMLESVDVGGIRVNHVEASVLEGAFPDTVLLGMSYLQHVEIRENDGILVLSRKY